MDSVKSMRSQREAELFWKPFSVSQGGGESTRTYACTYTHTQSGAEAASSVTSHTGYLKWRLHKEWADGCSVTRVHNRTHTHRDWDWAASHSWILKSRPCEHYVSLQKEKLWAKMFFHCYCWFPLTLQIVYSCLRHPLEDVLCRSVHQWNSNDESFTESEWIPALTGQVIYHLEWPTQ